MGGAPHGEFAEHQLFLANRPPSPRQLRMALGIVVTLLVAFVVTAPFVNTQLSRVDSFIPVLETSILFNDLITSALLFAQFVIVRRYGLLAIASGFLFTALITIPHALSFPGAFAPRGLLGGGTQTTAMLYYFWHLGSPLALIAYVLLKEADSETNMSRHSPGVMVSWSIAVVIAIVCGLTWIATAEDSLMPTIFLDSFQMNRVPHIIGGLILSFVTAVPLVLLWLRRRSVLDLWLSVMCCAWLVEVTINALLSARFNLGFYFSRIYDLTGTVFVLVVLLSETTALYARLARSMMMQRREREARLITMNATSASIAHEMSQPVGAIVAHSDAALLWLAKTPPNFDKVRASVEGIARDGRRAGDVIASLRALFQKDTSGQVRADVNNIILEILAVERGELERHRVSVKLELAEAIAQVSCDRLQLQQVILNLIMNAVEAMSRVTDRARVLGVKSGTHGSGVMITIEDSGTGIDRKNIEQIFQPFFTTKSYGMGLGLWICRTIIQNHNGQLIASPGIEHGSVFQVVLP